MTAKTLRVPEAAIEQYISDLLTLDGWHCEHVELQWSEKKRKSVGRKGMADLRCERWSGERPFMIKEFYPAIAMAEVMYIECKTAGGEYSKHQIDWAADMRRRGALVIQVGIDCPATIEGFKDWYDRSGLCARKLK